MPFWFIRHGQTDYNLAGLTQGSLEADLNETGRGQVERAGPFLKEVGLSAIVSSPMRRARQTADILNGFLHLPVSYEADLREAAFGDKEGEAAYPWFPQWVAERYTPENGESFASLYRRVEAVLCRVLSTRKEMPLIVAHGGVLRAMRDLMGLPKEAQSGNAIPLYCAPIAGQWQITSVE